MFHSLSGQNVRQIDYADTLHGVVIPDPYKWMEDIRSREVLNFIKEENKQNAKTKRKLKQLSKEYLEDEKSYIELNRPDMNIMAKRDGNYIYYVSRKGFCRKHRSEGSKEEIILNTKDATKGIKNYDVLGYYISPNQQYIGYVIANETILDAKLRIKRMNHSEPYFEELNNVIKFVWMNDSTILYAQYNKKSDNTSMILTHHLETPQSTDMVFFENNDEDTMVDITLSDSKQFAFVSVENNFFTEYHYLNLSEKKNKLTLIEPRKIGHRYIPDHYLSDSVFYILTNDCANNNKVVTMSIKSYGKEEWSDAINESDSYIEYVKSCGEYLVIGEKKMGCIGMSLVKKQSYEKTPVHFEENAYKIELIFIDTLENKIRFKYSSYITPDIYYDFHISSNKMIKIFETEVSNYEKKNYNVDVVLVTSHDGHQIPVRIIYNKKTGRDGNAPVWMPVYGSYGVSFESVFNKSRLPLLDRGFFWINVDVRGGGGMATDWHINGTVMNKKNSVYDMISVIDFLIKEKYTSLGKIHAGGSSNGGLVVGMAANMYPEYFGSIFFEKPKLDVLFSENEMEWLETGNPNNKEEFEYMLTYSPYQNIKKQSYPAMLFAVGYKDENVPCYEALKMVAKLKECSTGNRPLILYTDSHGTHYQFDWKKILNPRVFIIAVNNNLLKP